METSRRSVLTAKGEGEDCLDVAGKGIHPSVDKVFERQLGIFRGLANVSGQLLDGRLGVIDPPRKAIHSLGHDKVHIGVLFLHVGTTASPVLTGTKGQIQVGQLFLVVATVGILQKLERAASVMRRTSQFILVIGHTSVH